MVFSRQCAAFFCFFQTEDLSMVKILITFCEQKIKCPFITFVTARSQSGLSLQTSGNRKRAWV